jgi:hypothetical protein
MFSLYLTIGDTLGIVALGLLSLTGAFMALRKLLLKKTKNLDLLRRVHIVVAALAGLFLVLHIAFFINFPLNDGIILGYVSTAVAVFVWLTGTAFLERFRDSLFFHGTMTSAAVAIILLHAAVSGINLPTTFTDWMFMGVIVGLAVGTSRQLGKLLMSL